MPAGYLPSPVTPFVGREKELSQLTALLADPTCRLLTLLGPGGIGKTRLATELARQLAPVFAHGVCFVTLVSLSTPEAFVSALVDALGLVLFHGSDAKQELFDALQCRQVLLVLDNFENLLAATDLIDELIQSAPDLKVLITSRERLNLQSETVFRVGGMTYPTNEYASNLMEYDAVRLFIDNLQRIRPDPSPASETLQEVAHICRQVQGMPLALILAAAWSDTLSLSEICQEIARRFDILGTIMRDIPERHRNMHAVFDPSWQMLSNEERVVFSKLSIFRGGFTRDAAEVVAGASLPLLAALVNKSLIARDNQSRYQIHELLRQYAAEKLAQACEYGSTALCHLEYYVRLAERAELHLYGREQVTWCDRLDAELENLRLALALAVQEGEIELGLRLAGALGWFFINRSHVQEGLVWFEGVLAADTGASAAARAKVLCLAVEAVGAFNDCQQAQVYCAEALALARTVDNRVSIAWALSHQGYYVERHDIAQAAVFLDESIMMFREIADPMGLNHALRRRAIIALNQSDFERAWVLAQEALTGARDADDQNGIAYSLRILGRIVWIHQQDILLAKHYFEASLVSFKEARNPSGVAHSLGFTAILEMLLGNDQSAQMLYAQELEMVQELALFGTVHLNICAVGLADIARRVDQHMRAATLLGIAEKGVDILPLNSPVVKLYECNFDLVRTQLRSRTFAEAWEVGKAMTQVQALEYALESAISTPAPNAIEPDAGDRNVRFQPAVITSLSDRECEVLRLIADGLSNAEIAQQLYLSVGTVKVHTRHIYDKLDVSSRIQAVAAAQHLGIL